MANYWSLVKYKNSNNNDTWEFATLRLNQNGTLDTSFGDNGLAVFPVGSDDSYPVSVELQSDGKALLVGFSDDVDNGLAIARILTGGNLGIVDLESGQTEVLYIPTLIAAKASLDFELTKSAAVSAELFTSHGISVEKIMDNANVKRGKHKIELDLSNFAAGVYVLKLTVGDALKTIKIIKS
ncbi:MAG: T9SS type A sorting domain-containing protein [Flavobacteriaceae bacterium]